MLPSGSGEYEYKGEFKNGHFHGQGILTVNAVKKELITNFKFKKDNIVSKLDLVSREEFEVLKNLVEKQDKKIKKLIKKKLKR